MLSRSTLIELTDALGRGDPEPFIATLADDVVFELASGAEGDVHRSVGKAAVAELVGGMRDVYRVEPEPYRLYIDDGSQVVTFELSWVLQMTADAVPERITQVMVGEFREGLATAWRVYRFTKPTEF